MKRWIPAILATVLVIALGGHAGADVRAGFDAYKRGDYAAALREWKPLAEAGDATAQFNLGVLYEQGLGVPRDKAQAYHWYRKAALRKNESAMKAAARFKRDHPKIVRRELQAEERRRVEERQRAELRRLREKRRKAKERTTGPRRQTQASRRARRERVSERLNLPLPPGWTTAAAASFGGQEIWDSGDLLNIEADAKLYLPAGQTADDWSEMILVETVPKRGAPAPYRLLQALIRKVVAGCEAGDGPDPKSRREKGYLAVESYYVCTKQKGRNYGSFTMMKVIESPVDVDVIRRMWRGDPFSEDEIESVKERFKRWTAWFEQVQRGKPEAAQAQDRISTGFGFYVNRRGHILTTHKIVQGCRQVRFSSMRARLVVSDPVRNLALFKVRRKPLRVATFRKGEGLKPDDTVVIASYPTGGVSASELSVSTGVVSALSGSGGDKRYIEIKGPIQPGTGGAPLLDLAGNVVGILMAKPGQADATPSEGENPERAGLALNSEVATAFLRNHRAAYKRSSSKRVLSPADVGDRARSYTVPVECRK